MHLHKYQINLCPAEPRYIPFLETTDHQTFGSIPFDTLIFFLKFLENIYFERSQLTTTKSLSMSHVKIYVKIYIINSMQSDLGLFFLFFEQNNLLTKR